MEKEVATWLLGGFGAYKLFEPFIMKIWDKKNGEENIQTSKIEALNKRCECIEKDILTIQAEKVSRKELDKKLEKIEADVSEVKIVLAEIKVILKNKEE